MRKYRVEENINIEEYMKRNQSSISNLAELDKALKAMQQTHDTNIEAMETFIDIFKRKKKNINSKNIRDIYKIFSENRANQIFYEKKARMFRHEIEEKTLHRYYARVIQLGIKKISYYWMNVQSLGFLSPYIVSFMKELNSLFNDVYKRKNLNSHFRFLKLLFKENSEVQRKIYDLLIEQGYLSSMDEFYRINGIGLVGEKQYSRTKGQEFSDLSQSKIQSQEENIELFTRDKIEIPQRRKQKRQTRIRRRSITPGQIDMDLKKIKTTMEKLLTNMKQSFEEEKEVNKLGTIKQEGKESAESCSTIKSQLKQQQAGNINSKRSSIHKNQIPNFVQRLSKKKKTNISLRKRVSIEMMSYFSNQFKSVISHAKPQDFDFNSLSELILTSESNKTKRMSEIKHGERPYLRISKIQSKSEKNIKSQKIRGKIIEMAQKRRISKEIDMLHDEINRVSSMQSTRKSNFQPKLSFCSAPGVFLSFGQDKLDSNGTYDAKNKKEKGKSRGNKFRIKAPQSMAHQSLFQNQTILNQLTAQNSNLQKKNILPTNSTSGKIYNSQSGQLMVGFNIIQNNNKQQAPKKVYNNKQSSHTSRKNPLKNYLLASKHVVEEVEEQERTQSVKDHKQYENDNKIRKDKLVKSIKPTTNNLSKKMVMSQCAFYTVFDRRRRAIVMAR